MTRGAVTSISIDVPAMYADHHVVEVRRILHGIPGVRDVYASSASRIVEIDFDPDQTSAEALERILEEAGYRSEPPVPVEPDAPATADDGPRRRRIAVNAPSGVAVAFRHQQATSTEAPEDALGPTEG